MPAGYQVSRAIWLQPRDSQARHAEGFHYQDENITAIISIYRPKDTLPEWARPKFSTELGLLDYVMMRFPLSPAFPHSLPPKPAEVSHPTQQNILLCLIPKTLRCIMVSLEANNTCPLTTFLSGVQHAVHTSALPGVLTVLSPVFSRTY